MRTRGRLSAPDFDAMQSSAAKFPLAATILWSGKAESASSRLLRRPTTAYASCKPASFSRREQVGNRLAHRVQRRPTLHRVARA